MTQNPITYAGNAASSFRKRVSCWTTSVWCAPLSFRFQNFVHTFVLITGCKEGTKHRRRAFSKNTKAEYELYNVKWSSSFIFTKTPWTFVNYEFIQIKFVKFGLFFVKKICKNTKKRPFLYKFSLFLFICICVWPSYVQILWIFRLAYETETNSPVLTSNSSHRKYQ